MEILRFPIFNKLLHNAGDYFNPKLRKLAITTENTIYGPWLTKLIASYPIRLFEGLHFQATLCLLKMKPILDGFKQLQSLILRPNPQISDLHMVHLNCFYKRYKHLKFLSLGQALKMIELEVVKKLHRKFGVAKRVSATVSI